MEHFFVSLFRETDIEMLNFKRHRLTNSAQLVGLYKTKPINLIQLNSLIELNALEKNHH